MNIIITLDGPAGVGKSTLSKKLANAIGLAYLDTGAMFRTVAYKLGENALALGDDELAKALGSLTFSLEGVGDESRICCNGVCPGNEIRNERIGILSARIATLPVVRSFLKLAQQELGKEFSLVAEGRDMGTEIFPQAKCKFFVDASPRVRAQRRKDQLAEQGEIQQIVDLEKQITERDAIDRNRVISPLKPANDAIIVDTSNLDIEGVFSVLMSHVQSRSKI